MKRLLFFLLLGTLPTFAQKKAPLPEATYMQALAAALEMQQPAQYAALMPPQEVLDSLQPVLPKLLKPLRLDETEIASSGYQKALVQHADRLFQTVKEESDAMGLRWATMRLARYELVRQGRTRDSLLEAFVPDRFRGYVFFLDPMRQKTFCVLVSGLFVHKGSLYGGALASVYPAETIAAYEAHVEAARKAARKGEKYVAMEKPETDEEEDENSGNATPKKADRGPKGIVGERLYYTGYFDGEIPVKLFIRGYKGDCPEGVCRWAAIMLVGDEDEWVGLSMTKKEGIWAFTELPNKAAMELKPDKVGLVGTWNATDDNTGYEVELDEMEIPKKKLAAMEGMMDDFGL